MEQNYSSTKLPTAASTAGSGEFGSDPWSNPTRITVDDDSSATWAADLASQEAYITGSSFGFPNLPDSAVIDGIEVFVDGSQVGCYGTVTISPSSTTGKAIGALNGSFGGPTDLWGASEITPADIASLTATVTTSDVSGGDGVASIDYITVTVYWHIEMIATPSDVPTRVDYKVYSRDGNYLGLLPNVSSKLAFSQDINSAGASIQITCGKFINNDTIVEPLQDNTGAAIQTQSGLDIMARSTNLVVTTGDSDDEALYKNSNRVKAFIYNKWYPNGKLVFSGQINKVNFKYGGGDASVQLLVYSDGLDLDNYIARGYPFVYTQDQANTVATPNSIQTTEQGSNSDGWVRYGQSFKTGASTNNIGSIKLRLSGTATVTLSLYDDVNGDFLGSVTKAVNTGAAAIIEFQFSDLIPVKPNTLYFFALSVASGQSITSYHSQTNPYANGKMYVSNYSGGSGGGLYEVVADGQRDMYFITYSGTPTTTTTYSTQDPIGGMAHGILADYNSRGGMITERDFVPAGLSVTYTFNSSTILDSIKKILELAPSGYYSYIDLGTAEIDIKPTSTTPDFTIVRGKQINELTIGLSIENVKNNLLLSGGDTGGGTNLFKSYRDSDSIGHYGIRLAQKSDNRITLSATADAVGNSFIDENSGETQETSVSVLNDLIDITKLTPGKTIGFKNFGNFIDDMVLIIARREPNFSEGIVTLVLGRLPLRLTDEIQRINRDLLLEQTIKNPSSPS